MSHQIRSVLELPFETRTSKYAYVGLRDFERWFGDHEEGLMVLKLTNTLGIIRYVSVSGPHMEDHSSIYIPLSVYQEFELAGGNSNAPYKVTPIVAYELEQATKLVLKPLDSILYSGDMRALLEEALMDYPLLQKHTQFTVYLESLGGYPADVWVEDIEPAEVVKLGGEVEVEFVPEEGVASAVAASAVVAAIPDSTNEVNTEGGMSFPLPNTKIPPAQQLGGSATHLTAAQMREARLAFYQKK